MNRRLRETLALILTITVTFISFVVATPVSAQSAGLTRSGIVALANGDRVGLAGKLTEDTLLDRAAQLKANDMAAKGYFSHIDPSGNAPWKWFKQVGYYYWSAGENLAINFDDNQSVNQAWMNSPTHKANIVNNTYSRVGIGIAHGTYQGRPATFIVQFFAKPYYTSLARR